MPNRFPMRTWHSEVTHPERIPQVRDPAVRDILVTRRRALLMEAVAEG